MGPRDQGHPHKLVSHSPVLRLLWLQLGGARGLWGQSRSWARGQKREEWGTPCPPEEVGLGAEGTWEGQNPESGRMPLCVCVSVGSECHAHG